MQTAIEPIRRGRRSISLNLQSPLLRWLDGGIPLLGMALALSACDKLTPNGSPNTMSLLRSGAQQVCVAEDIRKSLRELIVPKADDVPGTASVEDKLQAISSIKISYDLTTLQSFDKAVSKAACNATVVVTSTSSGVGDSSRKFDIDYIISPSADDASAFIINARSTEAKAYVTSVILSAIDNAAEERSSREQSAAADRAKAQLLAIVNPKWMVGTWIKASADAANCSTGPALTLLVNHVFSGIDHTGRWTLNADQLHLVGSGPSGAVDDTSVITQADPVSFTATTSDGNALTWRRCARAEVNAPSSGWEPVPTPTGPQDQL